MEKIKKPVKIPEIYVTPNSPRKLINESSRIEIHNHYVAEWELLEKKGFKPNEIMILLNLPTNSIFGTFDSLKLEPKQAVELSDIFDKSFTKQREELNLAAVEFEKRTGKNIFAHGTGSYSQLIISSILHDGNLKHGKGTIQYGRLVSEWQPAYTGFLFVDIETPKQQKDKKMNLENGLAIRPLDTVDKIVVPQEYIDALQNIFPKFKDKLITFNEFAKQLKSMK